VNHFPNNRHLVRKDLLKKRIEGAKALGAKAKHEFDIIPRTYVLPK
jgi:tubulin polyglutamylase TTLL5